MLTYIGVDMPFWVHNERSYDIELILYQYLNAGPQRAKYRHVDGIFPICYGSLHVRHAWFFSIRLSGQDSKHSPMIVKSKNINVNSIFSTLRYNNTYHI